MSDKIIELKKKIQKILDEKENTDKQDDLFETLEKEQKYYIELLEQSLYKIIQNEENDINENEFDIVDEKDNSFKLFLKNDPIEVPANLFLHESIIKNYGLCPYIHNVDLDCEQVKKNRIMWLQQQSDKGNLYYELYNKIIKLSEIELLEEHKKVIEKDIEYLINITLNESQEQIYVNIIELIYEYKTSKLKTKKVKEKLNKIIFLSEKLYNDSCLNIHDYLNKKTNINICINDNDKDKDNGDDSLRLIQGNFQMNIEKYDDILNKIKNSRKYVKNILKHTYKSLELFLSRDQKPDIFKQQGKYFKKWSLLTQEEKYERLKSYVTYYVSKHFKNNDEQNEKMYECVKTLFDNKLLNYSNIKWNVKVGLIEKINNIFYDENTDTFVTNIKEKSKIKKSLPRTILSTQNDEIINEHILTFLIKNKKEQNIMDNKFKQLCFDNIKSVLEIKVISKSDYIILDKKYNDIYNIIQTN